jgi:hypothetical protein
MEEEIEEGQMMRTIDDGNSRRPRWGHLVNYQGFIYRYALTLKCSLNLPIYLNPNTAILGMSNPTIAILG